MSAVELVSPFPPDDCAARLRETMDSGLGTRLFGSRPVVGHVSGRSVHLRKRIGYGNSFQTVLVGRLEESDGRTVFRGNAGMHRLVAIFMGLWFCGVVLIGGLVFVSAIGELLAGGGRPLVLIAPPLMLAAGVGLVRFGRWLARDEERFLVDFVAEVINSPPAQEAYPEDDFPSR
jgi:hypothetical protein